MKRYLAFLCDRFYPSGGMKDFLSDHETLEEAIAAVHASWKKLPDYDVQLPHIYDQQERKQVWDEYTP